MQQLLAQLKDERQNLVMNIEWDRCYQAIEMVIKNTYLQMEKEQRIKDYNVGYLDAKCNHINDAENYVNEQDYLNSDSTV